MLQIITGKFFQSENVFSTLLRGTYYTNYHWVDDDAFETSIGRVLPSTRRSGLGTMTYELFEKIEGVSGPGVMISTGGEEIAEDFAAVFSFVLNVTCTTDPDLCRRLTLPKSEDVSRRNYSSRFLPRVFDTRVYGSPGDPEKFGLFMTHLLGLRRSSYESTIRAIRQYVAAMHDVGRDSTLAYSLLVTSIEALLQSTDVPDATWTDYDERKRTPIDQLLREVPEDLAERFRAAILASEHVAIARRFREFIRAHIRPEFYRTEADGMLHPVTRQDLDSLLKSAYGIRSGYVHRLDELEALAADPFGHSEVLDLEEKPTLTFAGLARIVRHVISTFVLRAEKVDRETHDWRSDLPNVVRMRLSPIQWIGNPDLYSGSTATMWLEAFLAQLSEAFRTPSVAITDLGRILDKIETMSIDNLKGSERRSVLTLYHVSTLHSRAQRSAHPTLVTKLNQELQRPTIEGLVICLLQKLDFPWTWQEVEDLHASYFRMRRNKGALQIGGLLETVFSLRLAEHYRAMGLEEKGRELISFAVENVPGDRMMLSIEDAHALSPLAPIDAYAVLPTCVGAP